MAKAWELGAERWVRGAPRHDVVVVDAPASGHGLALLRTPRTFAAIARVGPIAAQARRVADLLRTRRAALCSPSRGPPRCRSASARARGRRPRDARARPGRDRRQRPDAAPLRRRRPRAIARADGALPAAVAGAVATQAGQARVQHEQLGRLRGGARAPVLTLPQLSVPALGLDDVAALASVLGERLP